MVSKYDDEILELEAQFDAIDDKLGILRQLRAEELCPFIRGQIVVNKKGRTARISNISVGYGSDGYRVRARFIKKDGNDGTISRELWDWDKWEAVEGDK